MQLQWIFVLHVQDLCMAWLLQNNLLNQNAYEYILVVGVEKLSKITDWEDRNTAVLFGDGAGAAVMGKFLKEEEFYPLNLVRMVQVVNIFIKMNSYIQ